MGPGHFRLRTMTRANWLCRAAPRCKVCLSCGERIGRNGSRLCVTDELGLRGVPTPENVALVSRASALLIRRRAGGAFHVRLSNDRAVASADFSSELERVGQALRHLTAAIYPGSAC
jgi:hypothetical protein